MECHSCFGLWKRRSILGSIKEASFWSFTKDTKDQHSLFSSVLKKIYLWCIPSCFYSIFFLFFLFLSFFWPTQPGKVAGRVCSPVVTASYFCVDWIEHLWSNNIPSIMHISCVFAAIFQICFGESFSHTFGCHCTPWQIRFHFLHQLLLMFNSGSIHTL